MEKKKLSMRLKRHASFLHDRKKETTNKLIWVIFAASFQLLERAKWRRREKNKIKKKGLKLIDPKWKLHWKKWSALALDNCKIELSVIVTITVVRDEQKEGNWYALARMHVSSSEGDRVSYFLQQFSLLCQQVRDFVPKWRILRKGKQFWGWNRNLISKLSR